MPKKCQWQKWRRRQADCSSWQKKVFFQTILKKDWKNDNYKKMQNVYEKLIFILFSSFSLFFQLPKKPDIVGNKKKEEKKEKEKEEKRHFVDNVKNFKT